MRRLCAGQPEHAKTKTLSECGLPIGGAQGRVLVENGHLVPNQIRACRMGLRCAYCAPAHWRTLGEKVDHYAAAHEAQGGWIAHSALTVPHRPEEPLHAVTDRLAASWTGLRNHAGYRAERDRLHAAPITVLQIKWSPRAGWHPHYHVLWLMQGDGLGQFPDALAEAWERQTSRYGPPARQVHSELVQNRQGFWEYLSTESDRHPANDCLHPDHPGCDRCNPRPPGTFRGQPVEPTPGPRYTPTRGPVIRPTRGPRYSPPRPAREPRPMTPRPVRGFDIFTEIGAAAVDGSPRAAAILAHYIEGTAGLGRCRKLTHLTKRYGPPPDHEYRHTPGGERLWISGAVYSAVELANRGTGSPLDAIGAPDETARIWSTMTQRRIIVRAAADDGAPSLEFA